MAFFGVNIRQKNGSQRNEKTEIAFPQLNASPQVELAKPKYQEVDTLAVDDLLSEADVYWTYGKWHDAMQIYDWWITSNGNSSGLANRINDVARKYLDCAVKAMDFDAFQRMMWQLIDQGVDKDFLREMAVFGLMRDPSNFDIIGIAEAVDVDENRIISIAQKMVDKEKTPGQRKADLWKRNKSDARKLSGDNDKKVGAIGGDILLVNGSTSEDDNIFISASDANLFSIFYGEDYLADSASMAHQWKAEAVMEHLRKEMESQPLKLTVYVDYLRIAHGEGLRQEYANALLALFSVLLSANAGNGLRRRLLASGRLLGQHHIFDFLSGAKGKDFMEVTNMVRFTPSLYVPEKAWEKSGEWMLPLVREA